MPAEKNTRDPAVQAFMRQIMEALGVETGGELADLLVDEKLYRASQERKIKKWVGGYNAPNHRDTLRLLKRAGFICRGESPE